jgi:N-acetylated-alpha-linked acidic dipeptidase
MYVGEVKKLADTMRAQAKERNAELAEGVYVALQDPKQASVAPPSETVPPYFNFAPLDQASDDLTAAATAYEKAFAARATSAPAALNSELIQAERVLTDPGGLPARPWFKDMMYAPGFYTGYGVKTLPAVREAIEQKKWDEVDAQIARTAAAVGHEASLLKQATKTLEASQ